MTDLVEITLDGDVAASEIEQLLATAFAVSPVESYRATLRFHDTFDWRLYRAGWVLEEVARSRTGVLRCRNWREGRTVRVPLQGRMRDLRDLDPGTAPLPPHTLLGLRELMPLVELGTQVSESRLLNEDEKTVVRCDVEQVSASDRAPFTAVRLFAMRGYEQEFKRAAECLSRATQATPRDCALLHRAMGDAVGGFNTKPVVDLAGDASALAWMCAVCTHLLDVMRQNEFGIVDDIDTEFLHDFRVAVRRTRSAISQIRKVFTPQALAHYKAEFAWLGDITSPLRDLDVFLLKFDALRKAVPTELRDSLDEFHAYLRKQRNASRRRLLRQLRGKRYLALVRDWSAFLGDPPAQARGASATDTALAVAQRDTRRVWKAVIRQGRGIDDDSPDEALHELRKTCKKLRYLLEFYAPLHVREDSNKLVRRLKRLQENLGDFQDGTVQIEALRTMVAGMACADRDTILAIGALAQRAADHRAAARREYETRFERFDTRSTAGLFEHLFAVAGS